ncbi:MAG: ATP-binding protein, partial [Anaerolineae bacterium]
LPIGTTTEVYQHDPSSMQWQRPWLFLTGGLAVILTGLLILANPLPSFVQVTQLHLSATPEIGGIPLLILAYPLYITLCVVLSLAALRRPAPSGRVMGDLARRRARPWLMAASLLLLLVSFLVGWVMLWIVLSARQPVGPRGLTDMATPIAWFDLSIATLIAIVIILMGRAIVSYEIFTGKALPRRGFFRHWRSAVILAAGYSALVSWNLTFHLRPIYSLLLATIVMVLFYALFSWRSFAERDHYIAFLRPFVSSQGLYEQLLTSSPLEGEGWGGGSFNALCADVLGVRVAYLLPLGPLASLVGPGWAFPENASPLPRLSGLPLTNFTPQTICLPLDPAEYGDALWAIPLWSERGLIGVLLLGDKRDGGLYTQEEIEIARAGGERLLDTGASAELSRRLMQLQRQRLAQTQLLDRHTRRVLHDDILPTLHTAILMLTADHRPPTVQSPREASNPQSTEAVSLLTSVHQQISQLLRDMPGAATFDITRLGLIEALRRTVENEQRHAFDDVTWHIQLDLGPKIRAIPPLSAEVLFYAAREAIRNAAKHGRAEAEASLRLKITVGWQDGLEMVIEDDGVGITAGTGDGGSGQGLALHSTMLAVIGGTLSLESEPGMFTRVILTLPSNMGETIGEV